MPNVCTQLQWKIQRRNKKRKTHEQKTRNIQSNLIFFLHWPYNFIIRWASGGVTCSYVQTMANENGCIIRLKIVCLSTEKSIILLFYMVHAKVASLPVHSSEFVFFFISKILKIFDLFFFSQLPYRDTHLLSVCRMRSRVALCSFKHWNRFFMCFHFVYAQLCDKALDSPSKLALSNVNLVVTINFTQLIWAHILIQYISLSSVFFCFFSFFLFFFVFSLWFN